MKAILDARDGDVLRDEKGRFYYFSRNFGAYPTDIAGNCLPVESWSEPLEEIPRRGLVEGQTYYVGATNPNERFTRPNTRLFFIERDGPYKGLGHVFRMSDRHLFEFPVSFPSTDPRCGNGVALFSFGGAALSHIETTWRACHWSFDCSLESPAIVIQNSFKIWRVKNMC